MQMMYLMHHAFRRDLDAFAEAVRKTPVDDRKTWALLADRWELFAEVLHKHHSAEDDLIWPALMSLGTSDDVAVLEAMEAEHEEIDPLLESCAAGFRRLAQHADEDARLALAVRVCAARESLRRHLGHEENDAIAILQRLITPEQWAGDREGDRQGHDAAVRRPGRALGRPRRPAGDPAADLQRRRRGVPADLDPHPAPVRQRREARTFKYA